MKSFIKKILLLAIIMLLPASNLVKLVSSQHTIQASSPDRSFIEYFNAFDVKEIEKRISSLLEERNAYYEQLRLEEERKQNIENIKTMLAEGTVTYRKLFSDTLIVGDSLMNGLEIYNVIDKANIISMVSASLYHLEGNISKIIANNPKNLVLHYGINMMTSSESQLKFFISMYSDILERLKNELPDTNIFVSGIFNVSEKASSSYPSVEKYNEALRMLCEEKSVIYVDNSECLPGDGSFYGKDGIHVSKSFYTDVWLPHLYISISSQGE